MGMNNTRFILVVLPSIILINIGGLALVYYHTWKHTYIPTTTEIIKCIVFSGCLSLLLQVLNSFKAIFKIPDKNVFNSHFQPIVKEFVKFIIVSFIALHQLEDGTWGSKLTVWQVMIILAVFMVINSWEFVYEFIPYFYYKNNRVFLSLCDDFNYMEFYDDELRNDIAMKLVESLRGNSVGSVDSDETLAAILPKKISVADIGNDYYDDIDTNNPCHNRDAGSAYDTAYQFPCGHTYPANRTQTEQFNFNQNLFTTSPKNDRKKSIVTLPRSINSSPKSMNKFKSCYNLVDRLYSVSPKNTFHLVTASATAVMKSDIPASDDEQNEVSPRELCQDIDSSPFVEQSEHFEGEQLADNNNLDNESVHTADTDFEGGGGGGFKYTFPDGSKFKAGGGGGWDYKHKHKHKQNKGSLSSSSKSTISSCCSHNHNHNHNRSNPCEDNTRSRWITWLIPISKKKQSIKKKLSRFQFDSRNATPGECSSIQASVATCAQNNYNSVDEATPKPLQKFKINRDDFTNYVNVSLGLDRYRLLFDPIFERFNYVTIKDLGTWDVILCYLNRLVWIFGTMMVYSSVYLNDNFNFLAVVVVLKLFNINIINGWDNLSLRRKLSIKILLNSIIFTTLIVLKNV